MIAAVTAAIALSVTIASSQGHNHHQQGKTIEQGSVHDITAPGANAPIFEQEMYRDMIKMMVDMHAPGYSGNRDIDFLAMMIPHHQGAVDMARLVLIHGEDPLTRSLAEEIIASQQAEISAMKARLAILREKGKDPTPGDYPSLSGLRGFEK
jgi:uncharacterized protein (DUF305 family)